jgi:CheY-like chemotaxis protein
MDMIMPHMDGIETCQHIRSSSEPKTVATPVLGLSANVNSVDREKFMKAGASDFLLKPYDRQVLVKVIERLLFSSDNK